MHEDGVQFCRYLFSATWINACSYNMKVAGVYTIAFMVTNSQGLSTSVNRTLVVEPVCPLGETLCSNKVMSLCNNTKPIQHARCCVVLHMFKPLMHAHAV